MANNKMLIDAAHPEEIRVAVVHGDRVEEFDFESATKAQLKGNIYLARVTRVEPSLQAAFIDYGGNRHGFLAFSEIHPDYYQIPVSDREALIEEERLSAEEEDDDNGVEAAEKAASEAALEDGSASDEESAAEDDAADENDDDDNGEDAVELVGAEDALEEVPERKKPRRRRNYKIQEVIKRRQILLIQVVKEERGNKGAALTTYLSLAGRYCVLMPNTDRGGGISRKITNISDRKRLKETASSLNVPSGMGVIIRTAGANRTKAEIKRDYEYLLRLWENIRDLTLKSIAPCLVYEEGNLIKRSIRDLYNRDVEQVLVEGEAAYKQAKGFMKMLMPSHAKNVQPYKDKQPLFVRYHVENQLDAMFSPIVTLPSGGYLVINQAEALVAIDVNSGKATRKHSIEETAKQTNTEAAEEIARQLRLRDLAGLIVIDFIDMEEKRNNRTVERRLKDKLKSDRARIQVGRISHFGLLEMSRQRLRSSMLEGTTNVCPHCQGTGLIRSVESSALHIMRAIEMHALNGGTPAMTVNASPQVACYVLNRKRGHLSELESRFGTQMSIEPDESLVGASSVIRKGTLSDLGVLKGEDVIKIDSVFSSAEDLPNEPTPDEDTEKDKRAPRRRRRRKPRSRSPRPEGPGEAEASEVGEVAEAAEVPPGSEEEKPASTTRKRRRGKRGGRKHNSRNETEETPKIRSDETGASGDEAPEQVVSAEDAAKTENSQEQEKPEAEAGKPEPKAKRPQRRSRAVKEKTDTVPETAAEKPETAAATAKTETTGPAGEKAEAKKDKSDKPKRKKTVSKGKDKDKSGSKKNTAEKKKTDKEKPAEKKKADKKQDKSAQTEVPVKETITEADAAPDEDTPSAPKRKGWWSNRFSAK